MTKQERIRQAAKRHADGYAAALMKKGWTKEAAENHPLVSKLRRVSITYETFNRDGRLVRVTIPEKE